MVPKEEVQQRVDKFRAKQAAVGVSEREIYKALGQDFTDTGIGAIDVDARADDASFYDNLPMTDLKGDPINQKSSIEKKAAILAALRANSESANLLRTAAAPPPKDAKDGPAAPAPSRPEETSPAGQVSEGDGSAQVSEGPPAEETPQKPSQGHIAEFRVVYEGIATDLQQWDSLPGDSVAKKCKYVSRDGRFVFIMGFFVLILLIITLAKFFVKQ